MKPRNQLIEHHAIIDIDTNLQLSFCGDIVAIAFVLHIQTGEQTHYD
jgi:hypothetical protein